MAKSYLRLDTRRALSDGSYPIQIAVGYGTNLILSTGLSCTRDNWDATTCQVLGRNGRKYNGVLQASLTRVNNRILELREAGTFAKLSKAQLKAMLLDMDRDTPPADRSNNLGPVFARVVSLKRARTAEIYQATLDKLRAYCDVDNVSFDEINKTWLTQFSAWLKLSVNTKAIHLRNLRNVFNFALDEEITNNYPFRRFRIETEETAKRVLPVGAFRALLSADLSPRLAEYRDTFALMFYLIGINVVDLSRLTADSIIDGRVEYRRAKTGKLYSIALTPEASAIIDRYKGTHHLLRCFDRYQSHKDYAQHLNKALRDMLPQYPHISTYWARYSWATYAAGIDVPKDTISEALGHQHGSRVTGVYIKYSLDKVDEANKAVIAWLNG